MSHERNRFVHMQVATATNVKCRVMRANGASRSADDIRVSQFD